MIDNIHQRVRLRSGSNPEICHKKYSSCHNPCLGIHCFKFVSTKAVQLPLVSQNPYIKLLSDLVNNNGVIFVTVLTERKQMNMTSLCFIAQFSEVASN